MKRFIFGFDAKNPSACAAALRRSGFDAVVVGSADQATAAALQREGLALYLCFGAFCLRPSAAAPLDARGRPAPWFRSGCPNDEELYESHMAAALGKLDDAPAARGIFVDGARFASFASAEGTEAFFTCFCPRCMERMEKMGLDAERIRAAAAALMESRRVGDAEGIRAWFVFRRACVKAYMERFAARVHALPGGREACGFVFAPSLAPFVGQTEACAALDVISPMLYRHYPHPVGPACLGHEWAAAKRMFGPSVLGQLLQLAGGSAAALPEGEAGQALEDGFAPERVGLETAKSERSGKQRLLPILQIEDERLGESIRRAMEAGADGVGLFMYGQAPLPDLRGL